MDTASQRKPTAAETKPTAGHTPGPWRIGGQWDSFARPRIEILRDVTFVEGREPTTYVIGTVTYPTSPGDTVGSDERVANAHLIAAAPDLLNGVKALLGLLTLVSSRNDTSAELREALTVSHRIDEALAAIAKAEGR